MKVNLTPLSPKRAIFQNAAFFGKTMVVAMLAFLSSFTVNGQNCGCNDHVTVGLRDTNRGRETAITVDMILEDPSACGATFIRLKQNGMYVGIDPSTGDAIEATDSRARFNMIWVDCSYRNTTLTAEILFQDGTMACWGTVTIEDKKAPSCFIRDVTASCELDPHPDNITSVYGQSGTNDSYGWPRNTDNCTSARDLIKTWHDDDQRSECHVGVIHRTWTITDESGNSTICTQKITFQDQTAPSIVWPADVTLTCEEANEDGTGIDVTGDVEVSDNCSNLFVEHTDNTLVQCENACYKVLRSWRVVDWCKYDAETRSGEYRHEQLIKVVDTIAPTFDLPDTLVLGISTIPGFNPARCSINNFSAPEPGNLEDNCGTADYRVSMYIDTDENCEISAGDTLLSPNTSGNYNDITCGRYVARYTIYDCCGNSISKTVCVVIIDDVPPVAACDDSTNLGLSYSQHSINGINECVNTTYSRGYAEVCVDAIDDGSFDRCSDVTVGIAKGGEFDPDNEGTPPSGSYRECVTFDCNDKGAQVVWLKATDEACPRNFDDENDAYCWMVVNIEDKLPAVCTFTPADVTVMCGDDISEDALGSATFRDNCELDSCWVSEQEDLYCGGEITRTWFVRDCGGNVTSCSQTITIELPQWTYTCPADVTISCDSFINVNPDVSETGEPEVTITDSCNQVAVLWVGDKRGPIEGTDNEKLIREWEIHDWCTGKIETCTQKIILEGCATTNTSNITGYISTVSGAPVSFANVSVNNFDTQSDLNGVFNIYNAQNDEVYYVNVEKDGSTASEGLSTRDIILAKQHILGTNYLTNDASIIAADVNGDERVSTIDIISMRQVLLNQSNDFESNVWKFSMNNIESSNDAFSSLLGHGTASFKLTEDQVVEITGIKTGDVDGSFDVNSRTNGTVNVMVQDKEISAGETVTVPFNFDQDLAGYQMTINTTNLSVVSIEGATENFNITDNGIITSWDAFSNIDANFSITFVATANTKLSNAIELSNSVIASEAYSRNGNASNLNLSFETESANGFTVYQNVPNPFLGETSISFYLPTATDVTISVFDVAGNLVQLEENEYTTAGNKTVNLNVRATGVLFYTVKAGEFMVTKKMISTK